MLNSIEIYEDAGRKAGTAARHNDWSCVAFHREWFNRAKRLERSEDDQRTAADAYRRGYRFGRKATI